MKKATILKIAATAIITCGLIVLSVLYPLNSYEGFFYDDGEWPCVEVAFDSQKGAREAIRQTPEVIFHNPQTGKDEVLEIDDTELWNGISWCIYVILPGEKLFEDYGFAHGDVACDVIWEGGESECSYWKS